ncbi:MAG TPA: DUF2786 domain-containing protein [Nitrospiraceae bacterium]
MSSNTFTPSTEDQASILEKVRKLLAHAESTTHEAEAQTFMEKANKLMEDYAISQAMLRQAQDGANARSKGKVIVVQINLSTTVSNVPELYLLNFVAKANRCECWYGTSSTTINGKYVEYKVGNIAGFESDVAFVQLLFTSLCVQMANAVMPQAFEKKVQTKRKGGETLNITFKKVDQGELKHGLAWRTEFMQAYAERIGERFADAKRAREGEHTESMALALRDVRQDVRDAMANDYGITLGGRSRSLVRNTNYGARDAGRSAANSADLSGGNKSFKGSAGQIGR